MPRRGSWIKKIRQDDVLSRITKNDDDGQNNDGNDNDNDSDSDEDVEDKGGGWSEASGLLWSMRRGLSGADRGNSMDRVAALSQPSSRPNQKTNI